MLARGQGAWSVETRKNLGEAQGGRLQSEPQGYAEGGARPRSGCQTTLGGELSVGGGLGSSAGRISTTGHKAMAGAKSTCLSIGAAQAADTAGDISGVAVNSHWQPLPGSGACSGQQDSGSFGSLVRSCIPHSFPHRSALQVSAPMPVPADAKNTSMAKASLTAIDTGRKVVNVLILT